MPDAALLRALQDDRARPDGRSPASAPLHAVPPPAEGDRASRVTPRLVLPGYDFAGARVLERELGISHVLAQVLTRRRLTDPHTARAFLDGAVEHDPREFAGIDLAVETIRRH